MASGINFNPTSFQVTGKGITRSPGAPAEEPTPEPSDGFQMSQAQPAANSSSVKSVTMNVTAEQLASAAFQQTLATLSASGIQVNVALMDKNSSGPWAEDRGDISVKGRRNSDPDESQHGIIADAKPKPKKTKKAPTYGGD